MHRSTSRHFHVVSKDDGEAKIHGLSLQDWESELEPSSMYSNHALRSPKNIVRVHSTHSPADSPPSSTRLTRSATDARSSARLGVDSPPSSHRQGWSGGAASNPSGSRFAVSTHGFVQIDNEGRPLSSPSSNNNQLRSFHNQHSHSQGHSHDPKSAQHGLNHSQSYSSWFVLEPPRDHNPDLVQPRPQRTRPKLSPTATERSVQFTEPPQLGGLLSRTPPMSSAPGLTRPKSVGSGEPIRQPPLSSNPHPLSRARSHGGPSNRDKDLLDPPDVRHESVGIHDGRAFEDPNPQAGLRSSGHDSETEASTTDSESEHSDGDDEGKKDHGTRLERARSMPVPSASPSGVSPHPPPPARTPTMFASVDVRRDDEDEEEGDEDEEEGEGNKPGKKTNKLRGGLDMIRHLVSKKKLRFKGNGFDLDLSYITPRVIAMGFPSQGREGLYRNNMKDVKHFFTTYHNGHYKVYNLCSEREYERDEFEETARFPFDDHNPCPATMIPEFCADVDQFLAAHPENVVAIHCKAGKGRTGLMISCYLAHSGISKSSAEALTLFASQRTKNSKGVTIPSQIRYVHYYSEYLKQATLQRLQEPDHINLEGYHVQLIEFLLAPEANFDPGGGCDPYMRVYENGAEVYNWKKDKSRKVGKWTSKQREWVMSLASSPLSVQGNVKVVFFDQDFGSADDKMFSFWFNTGFLFASGLSRTRGAEGQIEGELVLTKNELDGAVKDKKNKHFPRDFTCKMRYVWVREPKETVRPSILLDRQATAGPGVGMDRIRSLVSKKKLRFRDGKYDLDLSYITDNIIAMGFPSQGSEGLYRNNMKDVKAFFQEYHADKFRVYNLCKERSYDAKHFNYCVGVFPFADHNPCPFHLIPRFCMDAAQYLQEDKDNIVVVHCKAGKGRTGLMVSALLLHLSLASSADQALGMFAEKRTANKKGVTIPSQARYVGYYGELLALHGNPLHPDLTHPQPVTITEVILAPEANFDGGGCTPALSVYQYQDHDREKDLECLYSCKKDKSRKLTKWTRTSRQFVIDLAVTVRGDFQVVVVDATEFTRKDKKMFSFWLNTSFLSFDGDESQGSLRLTKLELDSAVKDKNHAHFPPDFSCTVKYVRSEHE